MKFKISKKAGEDIEAIWVYSTQTWSVPQADRYLDLIFDEIEHLCKFPLAGKNFSSLGSGYRGSKVKAHIIFYELHETENSIEIIRVLHESMSHEDWIDE